MPKVKSKKASTADKAPAKKKAPAKVKLAPAKASAKATTKPAPVPKSSRPAEPRRAEREPVKLPVKPPTKELLELRDQLVSMLTDLRKDIQHEVKGAAERDLAHIIDSSDIAADAAEGDLAFRIAESEGVEAEEIQKAIDKIDAGTYGSCETCAKTIGAERLRFLPFATHCIKCQELAEIRRTEDGVELDDLAEGEEARDDS